jgi:hypothetical protein
VIDQDDQHQLFKAIRGSRKNAGELPTAAFMCDLYSFCAIRFFWTVNPVLTGQ